MKTLILIILLLIPIQVDAFDEWTKKDTNYQLTYAVFHIVDWGQTRTIAKNSNKYSELNPILGKHPSIGKVNTYFLTTLVGHTAISYMLPKKYRRYWQVVWIGLEAGTVAHNYSVGIKTSF